jgi:hypothetical protein
MLHTYTVSDDARKIRSRRMAANAAWRPLRNSCEYWPMPEESERSLAKIELADLACLAELTMPRLSCSSAIRMALAGTSDVC